MVGPEGAVAPAARQEDQELDDVVTGNDLLDEDDDLDETLDDEVEDAEDAEDDDDEDEEES